MPIPLILLDMKLIEKPGIMFALFSIKIPDSYWVDTGETIIESLPAR